MDFKKLDQQVNQARERQAAWAESRRNIKDAFRANLKNAGGPHHWELIDFETDISRLTFVSNTQTVTRVLEHLPHTAPKIELQLMPSGFVSVRYYKEVIRVPGEPEDLNALLPIQTGTWDPRIKDGTLVAELGKLIDHFTASHWSNV